MGDTPLPLTSQENLRSPPAIDKWKRKFYALRSQTILPNSKIQEEAHVEAVKQTTKDKEVAQQKLDELLQRSKQTIYRVSSVFPFDFFPDTLIIDPNKVCIVTNTFFYETRIHSILYQNIRDVMVETSLLFGTLKMALEGYRTNSVSIGYLKKKEAVKARRIIDGVCTSIYDGIDIAAIEVAELAEKAEEIGRAREKLDS